MKVAHLFIIGYAFIIGCNTSHLAAKPNLLPTYDVSNYTRLFLSELNNEIKNNSTPKSFIPSAKLITTYQLHQLKTDYYVFGFIKVDTKFSTSQLKKIGAIVGTRSGNIITLQVPINTISSFLNTSGITYFEISKSTHLN